MNEISAYACPFIAALRARPHAVESSSGRALSHRYASKKPGLPALYRLAVLEVDGGVRGGVVYLAHEQAARVLAARCVYRDGLAEQPGRHGPLDLVGPGLHGRHVPLERGHPARQELVAERR